MTRVGRLRRGIRATLPASYSESIATAASHCDQRWPSGQDGSILASGAAAIVHFDVLGRQWRIPILALREASQ
jgi:hypothetical protein